MLRSLGRHGALRSYSECPAHHVPPSPESHQQYPLSTINQSRWTRSKRYNSTLFHGSYAGTGKPGTEQYTQAWRNEGQETAIDARYRHVGGEYVEDARHAAAFDINNGEPNARRSLEHSSSMWREHSAVLEALQEEQPHSILRAFLQASENPHYIQILPATTLAEILRAIDPVHFLDQYKDVFHDFQTYRVDHLPRNVRSLKQIFIDYREAIQLILLRWRRLDRSFGIIEYRLMLNIARSVKDGKTALAIFKSMRADQVQPDTLCYNYLFEARSWSNGCNPLERWRFRVIPRNINLRQTNRDRSERGFQGYEAGYRGIREETIRNFDRMRMSGIVTDVDTFGQLMLGMAREGDIQGVKSVLKRIWDVAVDSILHEDDSSLLFENDLPPSSPLYPNQSLLFTIAHIFCINNQLPAALRVVDVFSRKYAVEIDLRTWAELFEWTFVLATRRYGKSKSDGSDLGQLPLASVENLWVTMISEPYNINPTMPMYNRRIRTLWKRQMYDEMILAMQAGRKLHNFQHRRLQRKLASQQRRTHEVQPTDGTNPDDNVYEGMDSNIMLPAAAKDDDVLEVTNVPEHKTSSDYEADGVMTHEQASLECARIHEFRDFIMVSRWARLLMAGSRWVPSNERDLKWERIGAPDAIRSFWYYRPRPGFCYNISTGKIQFPPSRGEPEFVLTVVRHDASQMAGVEIVQDTRPPPTALYSAWSNPSPRGLKVSTIPHPGG